MSKLPKSAIGLTGYFCGNKQQKAVDM